MAHPNDDALENFAHSYVKYKHLKRSETAKRSKLNFIFTLGKSLRIYRYESLQSPINNFYHRLPAL